MKTRINNWLDTNTYELKLGLDVSVGGGKWMHLAINNEPYFAETEEDREIKRKELRKVKFPI